MNQLQTICLAGTVLAAVGIWLMLPRGGQGVRAFGAVLAAVGLGLFASRLPGLGDWGGDLVFYLLAGVTVVAAAATVTCYSPVYSAIWFALTLLGTAGLFLFQGAQFLGVATVVVYAGAILVTFLFVLMLAQPAGTAFYDRLSWEASLSAATGAVFVGILTLATISVFQHPEQAPEPVHPPETLEREILAPQHMAHLGGRLFSQHLVAIEIAGTLLLVALVGCIAIVSQMRHDGSALAEQKRGTVGSGRSGSANLNGGAGLKSAIVPGPGLRGGQEHG
jgi:NADH-quinone oxidoreductase subunit J